MLEKARPETKAAVMRVVDMATGADGGVAFVQFATFIEEMDARAVAGDAPSARVVQYVTDFVKLLDGIQRFYREKGR
jgi:hypothetical protein